MDYCNKQLIVCWFHCSCRTVALWFYILVFDHDTTDPVTQKSCDLRPHFSAHVGDIFSLLSRIGQWNISFIPPILDIQYSYNIRYISFKSNPLDRSVNKLVFNSLPSDNHVDLLAENSKQLSWWVCGDDYKELRGGCNILGWWNIQVGTGICLE
jgi:hypothetical protein